MALEDDDGIVDLLNLAQDRRRESRELLFESVCDLFLRDDARLSDRERSLIVGILGDLVQEVEMAVRREVAERLSRIDEAPRELVTLLANDDIEIARPILMHSEVMRDPDLIEVIRQRGREHHLAIALRQSLSAAVSDALVATGDGDVIEGLLGNASATLSDAAMHYLVAEAQHVDRFQRPLLSRADLPAGLAMKLYWHVGAALRRFILQRFPIRHEDLDDALEGSSLDLAERPPPAAGSGEGLGIAAGRLATSLGEQERVTPALLIRLLRTGRVPVFVEALARFARLPSPVARRIVLDGDGESLAILCRACRIERSDFGTLYLLMSSGGRGGATVAPRRLESLMTLFEQTRPDRAQRMLAFWRRHPDYLDAVERMDRVRLSETVTADGPGLAR